MGTTIKHPIKQIDPVTIITFDFFPIIVVEEEDVVLSGRIERFDRYRGRCDEEDENGSIVPPSLC